MTPAAKAMKGYELYSWRTDGKWCFALLLGTNRLKTFEEITAPDVAVASVGALRSRLAQLANGEEIIWMIWADARLELPPHAMVTEVSKACTDMGLSLTIAPK